MVRLFERHRELAALHDAFADCVSGAGQLVIVTGGPGIGKTELLHEFANDATGAGARLLTVAGCPRERSLPMRALRELLNSGELPTDALECPLPPGSRFAPETVLRSVSETILGLARSRPLVLLVDDAHLLDAPSLHTLLFLLRRIRTKRITMVLAGWEQSALPDPLLHTNLSRQPHRRVRLAPLSEQGVAGILADQAGRPVPAGLAARYHRATGGNPMLVHALLDDGAQFGAEPAEPVPGVAYQQAVLAGLRGGETRHLCVARAVAALGEHADARNVALLLSTGPDAVQVVVDLLCATGLLEGYRFRLPAAAEAVLSSLDAADRSALHSRVARLLYLDGAPVHQVTDHLMAAGQVDEPWGLSVLRQASEQALAADRVEQSTNYLRLAIRESPDEQERHTLSTALARAEWRVNPAAVTPHLEPLHHNVLGEELDVRDAATVVRHMLWQGETGLADQAVTALAASLDPADAQVLAEVEFVRHCFYGVPRVSHRGDLAKLAALERATTGPASSLWATVALMMSGDLSADAVSQVTEALQSAQVSDLKLELTLTSLLVIALTGQPGTAIEVCEALLADTAQRGWTTWQALLLGTRARIALLEGDPATAAAKATEALELMDPRAWGVLIGMPLSTAVFANTALGRHEATAELLRRKVPDGMFNTVFGVHYLRARGHHYLSTDRPFAALNDFETCGHLMRERNPYLQPLVPWRTDLAQANLRIGRTRAAKELAEEQVGQRHPLGTRLRAIALRVLAGTSQPRHRTALLRESIDLLQACGDRLELALAFADLSATHYELGDYARARLVARQAAQETGEAEARAPESASASAPEPEPEALPAAVAVTDSVAALLSDAESRVAVLAALGYTNREISGRIHVTVSTVEQHLTRVYRKLNVTRRTELPSKLLGREIPALPEQRPASDGRARPAALSIRELPPLWRRLAL
ncbi:AAA family ATPase [Kitasatospora sp. NPDC006697]|uniref:helix-turn-helix transcriptional regulator n=1 Tax=Kitasatospora sp. NPDC006697 TaxID=3364020 RepID=UPI003691903E